MMVWVRKLLLTYGNINNVAKFMGKKLLPGDALQGIREEAQARWRKMPLPYYRLMFEQAINWHILTDLAKVQCKVHLVSSQHDYTSYEAKKVLAYVLKLGSAEMLPNCGHLVSLKKPDLLNQSTSNCLVSFNAQKSE
ncbi:hypothetical protein CS022_19125 [Veronia nyctiphanis]|uniref:Uncharacterized protein n=1 Tax=Veronia nyctiphanis TaxID=1278244 RepID=A0A4Q0YMB5_9GAMM|nr:hypothetical protein [Veronia nyctiphanis]RXJ71876.1 hypothetical protein CS022_19125 [Veronia nyctiphanis]